MKVFLSYAQKDASLASALSRRLEEAKFDVFNAEEAIASGDNWAKKIGQALDKSELMIVLLTPSAVESDTLRRDIEFALGSKKFEHRLFSVFVGPTAQIGKDLPWILLRLPHSHVGSEKDFPQVIRDIKRSLQHAA